MNEIKKNPKKTAPTGSTTVNAGITLNPPKSMMLPPINPVTETAKNVFDKAVIIRSVSPDESFTRLCPRWLERTAPRFPLFAGYASFFAEVNSCFERLAEKPTEVRGASGRI